jgi:hypothetical protein
MRHSITIFLFLVSKGTMLLYGQMPNDSVYQAWWANKYSSIFNSIDSGKYNGSASGYISISDNGRNFVIDFQSTESILNIERDPDQMYDNSTKIYITSSTSGRTKLIYETYALANILTIVLDDNKYKIGTIDGAADMPIIGLTFNYCNESEIEYLTLFVTKPLELTTTDQEMDDKKINFQQAKKAAKKIKVLPGSTLILTIRK